MSNEKYLNTYKIQSSRLPGHDYSGNATYFITINTAGNKNYFGDIVETAQGASPQMNKIPINGSNNHNQDKSSESCVETSLGPSLLLSPVGIVTKQNWKAIPEHFPFIILDEFVIMPNHMHGILTFNGISKREFEPNKPETKKGSLGTIINLFKGSVTKYANLHKIEFAWRSRYYDRIIRNEIELNNIRNYIKANPINWNAKKQR